MASKTQLRLNALTGSFHADDPNAIADNLSATAMDDIAATDMQGLLGHLASSIQRIHGAADFSNSAAGVFAHSGAVTIDSSGAGVSVDGAAASNFSTSDGTLTIEAGGSDDKLVLKGDHESDVAIHLDGNAASASIVDIDAGVLDVDAAGAITMDAGAGMSLDAAGASNLTTSSGALTLDGAGGVSIAGNSSEVDITTTGAVDVNGAAITVDASDGLSLDAGAASNFSTSAGDITLDAAAASLNLLGGENDAAAVKIHADHSGGGIDIDSGTGGITIDTTGGLSLDAAGASNLSTSSGELVISGTGGVSIGGGSNEVDITTTGAIDVNGAAVTVDASAGLSLDAGAASNLTTSSGALTLDGAGGVSIAGNSSEVDITTTGTLDVNAAAIDIDGSGAMTLDTSDTSNGISIGTATSGVPISIGHGTSEVTVNDNLTVTGDLTINGATTTVSTTNMVVEDKFIELGNGVSGSPSGDAGFVVERGSADNAAVIWDESADEFFLGTGSVTGASSGDLSLTAANLQAGVIRSSKLEIDSANENIDTDGSGAMTVSAGASITLDAVTDIVLDADGDNITMKAGSDAADGLDFAWNNSGSLWTIGSKETESGIVLAARGNGSQPVEALRVVGEGSSSAYARVASNVQLQFADNGEYISSNGTDLTIASGGDIVLGAQGANIKPSSDGQSALGESGTGFADLFFAKDAVVNYNAGKATMTHSESDSAAGDDVQNRFATKSFSGFQVSRISDSTLSSSTSTISFSPEIGISISGGTVIVFKDSSGDDLVFTASSASSSATSLSVSFVSASSTVTSMSKSSIAEAAEGVATLIDIISGAGTVSSSTSSFSVSDSDQAFGFAAFFGGSGAKFALQDSSSNLAILTLSSVSGSTIPVSVTMSSGSSVSLSGVSGSGGFMKGVSALQNLAMGSSSGTSLSLDVSDHDGSANGLKLAGTLVSSTAAELNLLDGGSSASSVTLAATDGFIVNDGGTMKLALISDIAAFFATGRSKKSSVLTAQVAAGAITTVSGLVHDGGADPDIVDVYLNGQMMLSGSHSANGDYRISGPNPTDSSLSLGGVALNSQTFSSGTTSIAFDGQLASAASSFVAGKFVILEGASGGAGENIRFEGIISATPSSTDTSISIVSGGARVFNKVTGAEVDASNNALTLAHSVVASGFPKIADALTTDDIVFHFALEVDDVVTVTKNG